MTTRVAGVREAKARLSQLLADVKAGKEWTISERGKPIARIVPVQPDDSFEARFDRLVAAGVIERRARPMEPLPPPIAIPGSPAQQWLREDRDRW